VSSDTIADKAIVKSEMKYWIKNKGPKVKVRIKNLNSFPVVYWHQLVYS